MSNYDYVIVGAGSSGSALAGRLAANSKIKILLIEAGPKDYNPFIKMPIGYGKLFYDQRVNWKFSTEPEENLNGKRMYWPRGKVLGGSSSINAMVFARGSKSDFDEWGENANGWHWQDPTSYFARSKKELLLFGSKKFKEGFYVCSFLKLVFFPWRGSRRFPLHSASSS